MQTRNFRFNVDTLAVPNNPFFDVFNPSIIKITNTFDDHSACEFLIENGEMRYSYGSEQEMFFKNLYIPAKEFSIEYKELLSSLIHDFPELQEIPFGPNEYDLINFALSDDMKELRLLPLIADIGQGKTTLILYTFVYMWQNVLGFRERTIPIIINFHEFLILFEENKQNGFKFLTENEIINRILIIVTQYTRVNNDNFWEWYGKRSKTIYLVDLTAINDTKSGKEKKAEIHRLRIKEMQTESYILLSVKYLKAILNKQVIIIFDNLDPLYIKSIERIIQYSKRIIETSSIKILYTIRSSTFELLADKVKRIILPIKVEFYRVMTKDVLVTRTRIISDEVCDTIAKFGVTLNNKKIFIPDVKKVFNSIIETIQNNSNIITLLARRNIRDEIKLLRILLRSRFLPEWVYTTAIFDKMELTQTKKIPKHVFLAAFVTNIYSTYVESQKSEVPGLMNVLSTNSPHNSFKFLYILILSYIVKNEGGLFELSKLKYDLQSLLSNSHHTEAFTTNFNQVVKILINRGLISSPEAFSIEAFDTITPLITKIEITSLGEYYINELIYDFNYVIYIKDEVALDIINFYGVYCNRNKALHQQHFDKGKYMHGNLKDLSKFLIEYGKSEIEFIKELKKRSKYNFYKRIFCNAPSSLYTYDILASIKRQFEGTDYANSLNPDFGDAIDFLTETLKSDD